MTTPILEDDLHAYADGRLAPEQATRVEAWLALHPEQRAEVEAWRAQSAALHRGFDAVLAESVPRRLLPAANTSTWVPAKLAAIGAWVLLGGIIGFLVRGTDNGRTLPTANLAQTLPRQAAVAHAVFVPEVRHPVEVGADQETHLVTWLSKRLGAELKPPRLDAVGYLLVGGRLLPGESGSVAQFMYENTAKQRLTLYVQPDAGASKVEAEAGFRYAREDGVDVFYWVEGKFGYALSGTTGRDDMLRLATLVYRAQTH